jgi:hypothetical protein
MQAAGSVTHAVKREAALEAIRVQDERGCCQEHLAIANQERAEKERDREDVYRAVPKRQRCMTM